MSVQLKKKILKLLEEDREFRYTVAGCIGYSEILRNIEKVWIEIKELRGGQERLWENQNKLWEEVKSLREGQNKLWEEVRQLRLDYNRLTINFENFRDC